MSSTAATHDTGDSAGGVPGVRGHGSIRLVPERCTSCMICARECPTWCIRIDSHAEPLTGIAPGARSRTRNVLDRFEVDWALCMYCGICIDQCPFDALEWAGPHVAPAGRLVDLVHGAGLLSGVPSGAGVLGSQPVGSHSLDAPPAGGPLA